MKEANFDVPREISDKMNELIELDWQRESGLLPTPNASDHPGKNTGKRNQDSIPKRLVEMGSKTIYLNPQFVMEMMGFPINWTLNPFTEEKTKDEDYSFDGWNDFPQTHPILQKEEINKKLKGITFPKWRNESIKAGGNAIVPQVALQIFKVIQKIEND